MAATSLQTTFPAATRPRCLQSEATLPANANPAPSGVPLRVAALAASRHTAAPLSVKRSPFACAAAEVAEPEPVEEVVLEEADSEEAALVDDGGNLGDSVEGKHRLLLKFVWLEKNIGITVDQVIPGKGVVPLAPYMFWPRRDAWEELKVVLESKPWLPRRRVIILLNQATDIINLWQSQAYKQT